MADRLDIDSILQDWPFEPGAVSVRLIEAGDGREVLQMRIEMGLLQLEVENRPDGQRPEGADTYYDYLVGLIVHEGDELVLSEEQCHEVDSELLQFYQRRICWLALHEYGRAVADADHNLALMEFVESYSPSAEWTAPHLQYKPFIYFHRTQAAALETLENVGAEAAIEEINCGIDLVRQQFRLLDELELEERFDEDDFIERLEELRESVRSQYDVGETLTEQLNEAIAKEHYERAAELRDLIAKRQN